MAQIDPDETTWNGGQTSFEDYHDYPGACECREEYDLPCWYCYRNGRKDLP